MTFFQPTTGPPVLTENALEGWTTMRRTCLAATCAVLVALVSAPLVPTTLEAQTTISSRAATLQIGGRLHTQYRSSSVDAADSDFFIRRARVIVDGTFNDFFVGRVQTDFAGGGATLLDAYVRMDFDEAFRLSVGQFKRSFDIFELDSSTDLSIFERDGRIPGFSSCTGVGSVCSLSRLTEALDYAGRDAGVRVDGTSGTFTYQATLTNGTGVGVPDENDGKSFSGRGGVALSDQLTVSANVGLHDYVVAGDTDRALAWGVDGQWGTWRDGLLVQAAVVGGDNWASLEAPGDPRQFLSFQAMGSYYRPLDGDRLIGVEPLFRLSVADPAGSIDDDGGTLLTPGVMLYLLGKNKVGANLDYYIPQSPGLDSELVFRIGTFLYF